MQAAGGSAAGDGAGAVAVLEHAAQPATDRAGGSARADHFAVAGEPHFTGGIAGQILPLGLGQQWAEVQCADLPVDIEVHHHVGALSMGPALNLAIPSGLHQPQERIEARRHRGRVPTGIVLFPVVFPLGDQRVAVRLEGGFERGRFDVRQGDPPEVECSIAGFGDRGLRIGPRAGIGARLQLDCGAQLADCRDLGQLRVMRIGPVTCACGDHPDLVQRQSALPQALGAAGKRFQPVGHVRKGSGIAVRGAGLPGHQGGD